MCDGRTDRRDAMCNAAFWSNGRLIASVARLLAPRVSPASDKFHGGVAVGHGARFAVAHGHPRGPRMGSLKSLCRTSYLSST